MKSKVILVGIIFLSLLVLPVRAQENINLPEGVPNDTNNVTQPGSFNTSQDNTPTTFTEERDLSWMWLLLPLLLLPIIYMLISSEEREPQSNMAYNHDLREEGFSSPRRSPRRKKVK